MCPDGTFMSQENATACLDCADTLAKQYGMSGTCFMLTSCHHIQLVPFQIAYLDPSVAAVTVCNVADAADVCDAPEYCMPVDAAQCNDEPNRSVPLRPTPTHPPPTLFHSSLPVPPVPPCLTPTPCPTPTHPLPTLSHPSHPVPCRPISWRTD